MAAPIFRYISWSFIFTVREESAKTAKIWRYAVVSKVCVYSYPIIASYPGLPRTHKNTSVCIFCCECSPQNIKAAVDCHVLWHVLGVQGVDDPEKGPEGTTGYACTGDTKGNRCCSVAG